MTDPDASPVREARDRSPKSPRWSAERRASLAEGRKAPHKRLACPNTPNGCFARAPVRLSVLRPPLIPGERSEKQTPGRKKRAAGTNWAV